MTILALSGLIRPLLEPRHPDAARRASGVVVGVLRLGRGRAVAVQAQLGQHLGRRGAGGCTTSRVLICIKAPRGAGKAL